MRFRRWGSTHPATQFRDDLDRLLTGVMNNPGVAHAAQIVTGRPFPAVNVWEDDANLYVEAELPGMKVEDIDISVVGNELTLKGTRAERKEPETMFHRQERGVGGFNRVLRLPVDVKADDVKAALNSGVLLITLPKAATARPHKVQVSVGS